LHGGAGVARGLPYFFFFSWRIVLAHLFVPTGLGMQEAELFAVPLFAPESVLNVSDGSLW
jgi:hypothetical protein